MANKRLNAVITIGGALSASLGNAFDGVKNKVGQVGSALRRMETEQRTLTNAIRVFGMEGKNVDGLRARYATLTSQVDRLRAAQERLNRVQNAQQDNQARRGELRGQMADTAALAVTAAAPVTVAIDRETHALGIAKQLQGARDEAGNLTQKFWDMRKQIVGLGSEIPMATNDLLDLATAGLRMGVSGDEIAGFTTNVAKLASALELPAEQVGDQFGKIKNVYKLSLDELKRLGDAVNYLDDANTVKGGELIDFLQRVGGSAGMAKVTAQEMAGIGTTLISMGESADTAATSTRALFTKLSAGASGTKAARKALESMGLNPQTVAKGMQKNAVGTIAEVMNRINKLAPDKRTGVITEIFGLEHVGQISKLVTGTKELATAIEQANQASREGTSVEKEFNNTRNSTASRLKILGNQVGDVADNIGTVLLPAINDIADAMGRATKPLAAFAEQHPLVTKVVVGTATALVGLRVATLVGAYAFTFMRGAALQVVGALATVRAQMALSAISGRALAASNALAGGGLMRMATAARVASLALISTPIGAAVAAIAAGGLLIYKYWDRVKAFFSGFGAGLVAGLQPAVEVFRAWVATMAPIQPLIDGVGSAVKTAWEWFTKLLEPVSSSKEQLAGATTAGEKFGRIVGGAINLALTPLKMLISGMTWVSNNAGAILNGVGSAFSKARSLLPEWAGGTPADQGSPAGASTPTLPAVPAIAASKGGGTVNDHSQTKIYVTQYPGQSQSGLADEVMRKIEEKKATRNRGAMHDGATE